MTVNEQRVALWVQALRNPELVQGTGQLAYRYINQDSDDSPWQQCCLDVACQVALANGLEGVWETEEVVGGRASRVYVWGMTLGDPGDPAGLGHFVRPERDKNLLPPPVRDWFGLTDVDPTVAVDEDGAYISASQANDELRSSFAEIADGLVRTYLSGGGPDAGGDLQQVV